MIRWVQALSFVSCHRRHVSCLTLCGERNWVLGVALALLVISLPAFGQQSTTDEANLASLSGSVTWDGNLPTVDPFPVTKNPEVCGTQSKKSPRLIVNAGSKAVKNVVAWLEDVPAGFKTKPESPLLSQKGCEYVPHIVMVPVGGSLRMVSSDPILHNIHATGAMRLNKPFPLKGVELTVRAKRAGIAKLNCDAGHAWTSAFVFVIEHPFYAVTGDDGRFEIKGVPPGEHTLVIWHEGWTVVSTTKAPDGSMKQYLFDQPKVLKVKANAEKKGSTAQKFKLSGKGLSEG